MRILKLNTIDHNSKASSILDLMRFLSALVVFLFHFYVPLPGYQAVMVFFVLSGYFISSTVLKSINENRWSWSDYLSKRIVRLWVVLLPCLILTLVWAKLQLYFFGGEQEISNYLNITTFFGNLFFLQGILVDPYGLNGPLWSLSYEFWYYILFPCLMLIIFSGKFKSKIFYFLIFLVLSIFLGQKIMSYFLIWSLGALVPFLRPLKVKTIFTKMSLLTFSVILSILSMKAYVFLEGYPQIVSDLSIGVTFAFLIYLIISFFNTSSNKSIYKIPKYFAGLSYTLYLAHYPLANITFTWMGSSSWPFEQTPFVIKILFALVVFAYCWGLALLTEKHTQKVR